MKKKKKKVSNQALVNVLPAGGGVPPTDQTSSEEPKLEKKSVDIEALLSLAEQTTKNIAKLEVQTTKNTQSIAKLEVQTTKNTQSIAELKEHSAQLAKQIAESNKRTDQIIANVNKEIGHINNRWGLFVESLIFGDIDLLFKKRGIEILDIKSRQSLQNKEGKTKEFDIVGIGEKYIVLVEIKSSLKNSDIVKFLEKLKIARSFFPEYPDRKIVGAIAYLFSVAPDREFVKRKGLFLIRATGSSASILNPPDFRPKEFN